jgi:rod shape determining protein RodA
VSTTPIQGPIHASDAAPEAARRPFSWPLDPLLLIAVLGLGTMSIFTLRQATRKTIPSQPHYFVERQAIYLLIGGVLMFVVSRIDYSRLRELKYGIYGALILSILAVFGVGTKALGATRSISLPFFSFQASELGKVLLILALAAFVVDRSRRLRERQTTALVMLLALVPALFVIAQPDLGSGMVYVVIAFATLFIAGTSWKHLTGLVTLGLVAIALVVVVAPAAGVHVVQQFQIDRLTAFLHPSESSTKCLACYQQNQSKIAIGAGGKTGRGANASQTAGGYLPESDTDFVFAAVGEQYGFVGAAFVLALFALLIWRGLRILTMAKNLFGTLVAGGIVAMLMFQVFVNVGMTMGIMPITGIPLPLVSYGGSSVIATLLAVGLLQSIYLQGRQALANKGRILRF